MIETVEMVGGPRDGETIAVRELVPDLRFKVPHNIELHDTKPVDYHTPMRIYVYKRVPETLRYYYVGIE